MIKSGIISEARDADPRIRYPRTSIDGLVSSSKKPVVVVGTSKDPNAKITVLLLDPAASRPELAAKVPTTDAAAAAVDAEGRLLVELRRRNPMKVLHTIPRVVDLVEFDGRAGVVMTALPGVPMTTSYLRWLHTASKGRVVSDFLSVAKWLTAFQEGTARPPAPLDMDGGIQSRLARRFASAPELDGDLSRLDDIYARLRRQTTPRTAVHGDLWCGNILVSNGEVSGVVDWEAGCISGEPSRDLARFALMYALYLDRHTKPGRRVLGHRTLRAGVWGAGLVYAIDGAGWFPDLFRRFLRQGLRRLGASPDCWRDVALVGIAEVAATTDDENFARRHLDVFRRLTADAARSWRDL